MSNNIPNNIAPSPSASSSLTYAQANSIFLSKNNLSTALSQLTGTINLNSNLVVNPSLKILSSGINIFNVTSAGSTTTWRNTLDDRFGNAIFNSINSMAGCFQIQKNGLTFFNCDATTKKVNTFNNVIDDGSGNVQINGEVTLSSKGLNPGVLYLTQLSSLTTDVTGSGCCFSINLCAGAQIAGSGGGAIFHLNNSYVDTVFILASVNCPSTPWMRVTVSRSSANVYQIYLMNQGPLTYTIQSSDYVTIWMSAP